MRSFLSFRLLLFASLVCSQDNRDPDPNQQFIYPPLPGPQWSNDPTVFAKNPEVMYGIPQSQPFKWKTNTTIVIFMYQEGNPGSVVTNALTGCISSSFMYWDGQIGRIDIKNGSVMFLGAFHCTKTETAFNITSRTPAFFSHYFNLTRSPDAIVSGTTSSLSPTALGTYATSIALSTSTSTGPPAQIQSATQTPQSYSTTNSVRGSSAATIGAGVGGSLCGALAVTVVAVLYFKYCKKQEKKTTQQDHTLPSHQEASYYPNEQKHIMLREPQELQATSIGKTTPRVEVP